MPKYAKGDNSKKKKLYLKKSPDNILFILYQFTKFEAPSLSTFWDILITILMSKYAKGDNSKKK